MCVSVFLVCGRSDVTLLALKNYTTVDPYYPAVCGYVRARISLAIARATHLCLRGSRIPAGQMSHRRPQWEDQAGLGLFRC